MSTVAEPPGPPAPPPVTDEVLDKGLKKNAIDFKQALAIGLDSTAPAYSLAAVIGIVVATVGLQAPAVLLVAFVPIFLVSLAFASLNRADPDCGTTFSWTTRAFGPSVGWVCGWAVTITGILVIGSLADTAAVYTLLLFDVDEPSKGAVVAITIFLIVSMTAITVIGTELSARLQQVMVTFQISVLVVFAIIMLVKAGGADAPGDGGGITPELSWINPFEVPFEALALGLLTSIFIYWGWESAVTVNEETKDSASAPGRAAVLSTAILLATYLLVAFALQAWFGATTIGDTYNDDIAVLADAGTGVLGEPWDKFVVLAVLTSALAATQTTILPASRTSLSMASRHAFPRALGAVHPKFQTPWIGTIVIGVLALAYYIPAKLISENFLFDTITALGIGIAFYYAMTGLACVVFYRKQLTKSAYNFFVLGVGPLTGALILFAIFGYAIDQYADVSQSYYAFDAETGEPTGYDGVFGLGPAVVIGLGGLLLGVVGVILWRLFGDKRFFDEKRQVAPAYDPPPLIAPKSRTRAGG